MLEQLFGNRSIARILFFLLINGRAYAHKLARHFGSPLTPIQQGLAKLEELGILESFMEGKIRTYQFNKSCPFLTELEALLRRTYILMSAAEKKSYYDHEPEKTAAKTKTSGIERKLVLELWSRLPTIKTLKFSAFSHSAKNSDWTVIGNGTVNAELKNDNRILFYESGTWKERHGNEFIFTNVFRWSLDRFKNLITLEHLRFGEKNPVFLFDLAKINDDTLASVSSYVCKEDSYLGQVKCTDKAITLNWRIIGPKKNEEIHYFYGDSK